MHWADIYKDIHVLKLETNPPLSVFSSWHGVICELALSQDPRIGKRDSHFVSVPTQLARYSMALSTPRSLVLSNVLQSLDVVFRLGYILSTEILVVYFDMYFVAAISCPQPSRVISRLPAPPSLGFPPSSPPPSLPPSLRSLPPRRSLSNRRVVGKYT